MNSTTPASGMLRNVVIVLLEFWAVAATGILDHALPEAAAADRPAAEQRVIPIERTLQTAAGYLRVHARLVRNGEVLKRPEAPRGNGPGNGGGAGGLGDLAAIEDLLHGNRSSASFPAFLDTGASSILLSKKTAQRFGVEREPGAVYHETGLHGALPLHVSRRYGVLVAGTTGTMQGGPRRFDGILANARLQLTPKPPSNPLIEMAVGAIDVVGMPVIRKRVVEMDPAPLERTQSLLAGMGGGDAAAGAGNLQQMMDRLMSELDQLGIGPGIRLHPAGHQPKGAEVVVPLRYVDFSGHRHPKDRGPRPSLTPNPMVPGVVTAHNGRLFKGDWLLDTGAPASIISTKHAKALGLYDEAGNPAQPPAFKLPLGGVSGDVTTATGFRINRLRIQTAKGHVLEYRGVYVLVHDVTVPGAEGEDGQTLAGIFGTNLLLPTVSGLGQVSGLGKGLPSDMAASPYERIWIDGPGGRLLLDLKEAGGLGGRNRDGRGEADRREVGRGAR